MYKTLFSTQKGTWHTMRNKNVLNSSSYCFEQARHLSSEWIIITYRFLPEPYPFSSVRAPASAAVTGAARRAPELCVCLSESARA